MEMNTWDHFFLHPLVLFFSVQEGVLIQWDPEVLDTLVFLPRDKPEFSHWSISQDVTWFMLMDIMKPLFSQFGLYLFSGSSDVCRYMQGWVISLLLNIHYRKTLVLKNSEKHAPWPNKLEEHNELFLFLQNHIALLVNKRFWELLLEKKSVNFV